MRRSEAVYVKGTLSGVEPSTLDNATIDEFDVAYVPGTANAQ